MKCLSFAEVSALKSNTQNCWAGVWTYQLRIDVPKTIKTWEYANPNWNFNTSIVPSLDNIQNDEFYSTAW